MTIFDDDFDACFYPFDIKDLADQTGPAIVSNVPEAGSGIGDAEFSFDNRPAPGE